MGMLKTLEGKEKSITSRCGSSWSADTEELEGN